MDYKIRLGVDEIPSLFTNRFHHLWMAVTSIRHADATGEVKKFAPVISIDVRSFGALRNEVEDATPDWSHVLEVFSVELIRCHSFLSGKKETGKQGNT